MNRDQLLTEIGLLIADNNSYQITAADVRQCLTDIVDTAMVQTDINSMNGGTITNVPAPISPNDAARLLDVTTVSALIPTKTSQLINNSAYISSAVNVSLAQNLTVAGTITAPAIEDSVPSTVVDVNNRTLLSHDGNTMIDFTGYYNSVAGLSFVESGSSAFAYIEQINSRNDYSISIDSNVRQLFTYTLYVPFDWSGTLNYNAGISFNDNAAHGSSPYLIGASVPITNNSDYSFNPPTSIPFGGTGTPMVMGMSISAYTVESSYSVLLTDDIILVNGTGATITLPNPAYIPCGKTFTIKNTTGAAGNGVNTLIIATAASIDNASSITLINVLDYITVVADGSSYWIVASSNDFIPI